MCGEAGSKRTLPSLKPGTYWARGTGGFSSPMKMQRFEWWTRTQRIRTQAEVSFEVVLRDEAAAPLYQRIAGKARHLHQLGLGPSAIARRLNTTDKTVVKALAWLARPRLVE